MDFRRTVVVSGLPQQFNEQVILEMLQNGHKVTNHIKTPGKLLVEFESVESAENSLIFSGVDIDFDDKSYGIDINEATLEDVKKVAPPEVEGDWSHYDLKTGEIKTEDIPKMLRIDCPITSLLDKSSRQLVKLMGGQSKIKHSYTATSGFVLVFNSEEEADRAKLFDGIEYQGKPLSLRPFSRDDAAAFYIKVLEDEWVRVESKEDDLDAIAKAQIEEKAKKLELENQRKKAEEAKEAAKRAEEQRLLKLKQEEERERLAAVEREAAKKAALEKAERERLLKEEALRKKQAEEIQRAEQERLKKEKEAREQDELKRPEPQEQITSAPEKLPENIGETAVNTGDNQPSIQEKAETRPPAEQKREEQGQQKQPEDTADLKVKLDGDVMQQRFSSLEDQIRKRPSQPPLAAPKVDEQTPYGTPPRAEPSPDLIAAVRSWCTVRDRLDGIEKAFVVLLALVFLRAVWVAFH